MKKTISLLLVLILACSMALTGCGSSETAAPAAEEPEAQQASEPEASDEHYVLTIGHGSAVDSLEDQAVNIIAEKAAELSDGRIELQVFPAEQLGNFASMMESTSNGSQDLVWGDLTWLGNVVPDLQILSMAYCFRDQDHINAFMDSEVGAELRQELLDATNIKLLNYHANSLPRVAVSKEKIESIDDFVGLKMRVPGIPIFVDVWTQMETKPTSVSWGEVYLALQQNVVEAMECGYEFVYSGKFYEVAPNVTLTNHVRGLRGMLINNDSFNDLPEDIQEILYQAGVAGEEFYNAELVKIETEHTELLLDAGVSITEVDLTPYQEKMAPLVERLESEGFWSAGLYAKIQEIQ